MNSKQQTRKHDTGRRLNRDGEQARQPRPARRRQGTRQAIVAAARREG